MFTGHLPLRYVSFSQGTQKKELSHNFKFKESYDLRPGESLNSHMLYLRYSLNIHIGCLLPKGLLDLH